MARADIQVLLDGGERDGAWNRYEPGSEVAGVVQVTADSSVRCNHLYCRLFWRTEGRGDRDEGKVAQLDLFQGDLPPRVPLMRDFRFTLPREPWSYAGRYVSIVWEIGIEVDVPWSVNPRHGQPFVMAPQGEPARLANDGEIRYDVVLKKLGADKSRMVQALQETSPQMKGPGGSLVYTALMKTGQLESGGFRVLEWATESEAKAARDRLRAAGAEVELRPR